MHAEHFQERHVHRIKKTTLQRRGGGEGQRLIDDVGAGKVEGLLDVNDAHHVPNECAVSVAVELHIGLHEEIPSLLVSINVFVVFLQFACAPNSMRG